MAMDAGDARLGTGLAGAIASAMRAAEPGYNVHAPSGDFLPNAIANAVVDYLKAEAEVTGVTVDTGTGAQTGTGSLT